MEAQIFQANVHCRYFFERNIIEVLVKNQYIHMYILYMYHFVTFLVVVRMLIISNTPNMENMRRRHHFTQAKKGTA